MAEMPLTPEQQVEALVSFLSAQARPMRVGEIANHPDCPIRPPALTNTGSIIAAGSERHCNSIRNVLDRAKRRELVLSQKSGPRRGGPLVWSTPERIK